MTTMKAMPSARLGVKLAVAAGPLRAATAALWQPAGLSTKYLAYLREMHGLVRASVPLMELAARRCAGLGADGVDPLAGPLQHFYTRHAREEEGHDAWILADLRAAGAVADEDTLPSPAVACLAGAQYYWIEHHHPIVLLGYIAALEGNPPGPRLADALHAATGLPAAAFSTVRDHALLDADHAAQVNALLDRLPLTPARERAVAVSALHTLSALTRLFLELAGGTAGHLQDPRPGGSR